MEDTTVRAITIGVGVLISIVTITAVLTYYNTAKDTVREIGSATDISGLYDKSIEDILLKSKISGTDIKNIINYFKGRNDVQITANGLKVFFNDDFTNGYRVTGTYTNILTGLNETMVRKIVPNCTYNLTHSLSGGKLSVNIRP